MNGCQFKTLLYAFNSFQSKKIVLNYQLQNEVSKANFNTCKRIYPGALPFYRLTVGAPFKEFKKRRIMNV